MPFGVPSIVSKLYYILLSMQLNACISLYNDEDRNIKVHNKNINFWNVGSVLLELKTRVCRILAICNKGSVDI